ncbi:hypothetical protein H3H36_19710 [Duganella sp. FT3S]|uniref:O-antigen ligase domain-containing protein n=1 Tax=Rugamonas fusca TaxID=2758568 RepID=A0A7W2EKQ2_9BURK|nr:hypothetical protein [Rugamonas fusca]MBA5607587.1 hypothetical protein [Rugamonas fusca]
MNIFRRCYAAVQRVDVPAAVRRLRARLPSRGAVLASIGVVLLSLFVGMVVALGVPQVTLVLVGVIVLVPFVIFVGTRELLPLMFIYVFLVQGAANSFAHFHAAIWLGSGFAFLFLCRTALELVDLRAMRALAAHVPRFGSRSVIWCAVLFLVCFSFSLSLGHASMIQIISAVRFALPMFGVLFALYFIEFSERRIALLWNLLLLIVVLQIPLVIYQHFFSMTIDGWDSVVGSFGYGMSPVLVLFSIAGISYALARWMRGLMSTPVLVLIILAGCANMLLGEVKAVLFWMPMAIVLILRKRILRNVFAFAGYGLLIAGLLVGTALAYKAMYWGEKGTGGGSLEDKIARRGGYFFNPYEINQKTGEVSRIASLYIWYRDPIPTVRERLIGYGPGASAAAEGTGYGVVAKRFRPLRVNSTALSALLWDVGILGTLVFIAIPVAGIATALRFVRRAQAPPSQLAIVDTSLTILCLLLTTMIYNRNLVDETTVQLLAYFCLGNIVQFCRYHRHAGAEVATAQPQPARAPTALAMRA